MVVNIKIVINITIIWIIIDLQIKIKLKLVVTKLIFNLITRLININYQLLNGLRFQVHLIKLCQFLLIMQQDNTFNLCISYLLNLLPLIKYSISLCIDLNK